MKTLEIYKDKISHELYRFLVIGHAESFNIALEKEFTHYCKEISAVGPRNDETYLMLLYKVFNEEILNNLPPWDKGECFSWIFDASEYSDRKLATLNETIFSSYSGYNRVSTFEGKAIFNYVFEWQRKKNKNKPIWDKICRFVRPLI